MSLFSDISSFFGEELPGLKKYKAAQKLYNKLHGSTETTPQDPETTAQDPETLQTDAPPDSYNPYFMKKRLEEIHDFREKHKDTKPSYIKGPNLSKISNILSQPQLKANAQHSSETSNRSSREDTLPESVFQNNSDIMKALCSEILFETTYGLYNTLTPQLGVVTREICDHFEKKKPRIPTPQELQRTIKKFSANYLNRSSQVTQKDIGEFTKLLREKECQVSDIRSISLHNHDIIHFLSFKILQKKIRYKIDSIKNNSEMMNLISYVIESITNNVLLAQDLATTPRAQWATRPFITNPHLYIEAIKSTHRNYKDSTELNKLLDDGDHNNKIGNSLRKLKPQAPGHKLINDILQQNPQHQEKLDLLKKQGEILMNEPFDEAKIDKLYQDIEDIKTSSPAPSS